MAFQHKVFLLQMSSSQSMMLSDLQLTSFSTSSAVQQDCPINQMLWDRDINHKSAQPYTIVDKVKNWEPSAIRLQEPLCLCLQFALANSNNSLNDQKFILKGRVSILLGAVLQIQHAAFRALQMLTCLSQALESVFERVPTSSSVWSSSYFCPLNDFNQVTSKHVYQGGVLWFLGMHLYLTFMGMLAAGRDQDCKIGLMQQKRLA